MKLEGVDIAEVVGVKHKLFDEGIFAFVKLKKGVSLSAGDILSHCGGIASYKRPCHVELWPQDKDFPVTRSTKVDKLELKHMAEEVVEKLRAEMKWDAG